MKAIRIHEYGSDQMLKFEDAPTPTIESEDVLIKVIASSINPVDWKIREGHLKTKIQSLQEKRLLTIIKAGLIICFNSRAKTMLQTEKPEKI